jgi:hypothetical protein
MIVLCGELESITEQVVKEGQGHIVLGGEENDHILEDVSNNTQFDSDEKIIIKREVQKLTLFDSPYLNQVPQKILDRWVPLGMDTINGANPLMIYSPFVTLLNTSYVQQALKTFFYMRSAIEIKLVYPTSVWNYGATFITNISGGNTLGTSLNYSWFAAPTPGASGNSFGRMLSHDPIILDLSQQEEVIFDLPWISPANVVSLKAYFDTLDPMNVNTVNFLTNMFKFAIYQVFPTGSLDSHINTDFNYNLFARFKETTVQGFTFDNTQTGVPIEAQSNFLMTAMGGLAAQATPVVSSWLKTQADKAIKSGLDTAGGFLDSYLDGDQEKKTLVTSEKREEGERQTGNVLPDMFGDLVANNQMCKVVLPSTNVVSPWHSVLSVIKKPSYFYGAVITGTGATTQYYFFVMPYWVTGTSNSCDRLSFFSQYARFWRGSIKYHFLFLASPMASVKLKIILKWNSNDNITTEPESLLTRIVTIRGTTCVTIPVPFLYTQQWLPTMDTALLSSFGRYNVPTLWVERYQPVYSTGDLPASVHMYVWRSAGDDFLFSGLREAGSYTTTLVEAQMKVSETFSEETAFLGARDSRVFEGRDVIQYVEDIAGRFSCDQTGTTTYPIPIDHSTGSGRCNLDTISSLFYFFRGSIDYKYIVGSPGTSTQLAVVADDYSNALGLRTGYSVLESVANGKVVIDPRFTSVLEYRQPALSQYDWLEIPQDGTNYYPAGPDSAPVLYTIETDGTGTTIQYCFRKITVDSGYYYEVPPPYIASWATS